MLEETTLDERYVHIVDQLYEALGSPQIAKDRTQGKIIAALVKDDCATQSNTFFQSYGLTDHDLQQAEIELSTEADLNGTYIEGDSVDNDKPFELSAGDNEGGLMELKAPSDSFDETQFRPRIYKKYKHINTEPRGPRTPLYDAIELYLSNQDKKGPIERPDIAIQRIFQLIGVIHDAYQQYYYDIHKPSFGENNPLAFCASNKEAKVTAAEKADKTIKQLWNAINESNQGEDESLYDLMKRYLGPSVDTYMKQQSKNASDTNDPDLLTVLRSNETQRA